MRSLKYLGGHLNFQFSRTVVLLNGTIPLPGMKAYKMAKPNIMGAWQISCEWVIRYNRGATSGLTTWFHDPSFKVMEETMEASYIGYQFKAYAIP